jgi:hypothetical protein
MKTFEIEVVRTYTTTIQVELPDTYTPSDVRRITLGDRLGKLDGLYTENQAYHEIWDKLGEAELEQMDTEMQTCKVYELYHEEFKSFNEAPYGQEDE